MKILNNKEHIINIVNSINFMVIHSSMAWCMMEWFYKLETLFKESMRLMYFLNMYLFISLLRKCASIILCS